MQNSEHTFTVIKDSSTAITDKPFSIEYSKTNRLITALYMVTDILDKEEPLRNKLRTLGSGIISDINAIPASSSLNSLLSAENKIIEILAFLEIAKDLNMISEMNSSILKKEFYSLKKSLNEKSNPKWLADFLAKENSKGHNVVSDIEPIRIGVQKGATLMQALSDKVDILSDRKVSSINSKRSSAIKKENQNFDNFNILKQQRRNEILSLLRLSSDGLTISDIKLKAVGILKNCGEKTLQRELISMLKDSVLYKKGEKRWSRYFIK